MGINPHEPALIDNLAFVYASLGKIKEAEEAISKVDAAGGTDLSAITLTATKGLICFRKGMIEPGRNLYLEAMDKAKKKGILNYRAMAAAYLQTRGEKPGRDTFWCVADGRILAPLRLMLMVRTAVICGSRMNAQPAVPASAPYPCCPFGKTRWTGSKESARARQGRCGPLPLEQFG